MAKGVVKFFNGAKGFGFISPDDGGSDVFVHVSAAERAGMRSLNEGDQVTFELEQDRRSGKVSAVDLEVTGVGAPAPRSARPSPGAGGYGRGDRDPAPREEYGDGETQSGVVKWFNPQKGFGFIQPDSGGGDVFVHISDVERAGLRTLQDGQPIAFEIKQDRRTGKASATNLRVDG